MGGGALADIVTAIMQTPPRGPNHIEMGATKYHKLSGLIPIEKGSLSLASYKGLRVLLNPKLPEHAIVEVYNCNVVISGISEQPINMDMGEYIERYS